MTEASITEDRHPRGRSTKLTQEFLAAAYEIINHERNPLIYTDEDLLFLINEKLSPEARISKSSFEKWKNDLIDLWKYPHVRYEEQVARMLEDLHKPRTWKRMVNGAEVEEQFTYFQ